MISSFVKLIRSNTAIPLIIPTRQIRPHINICKEKFQLRLDVHDFEKDEIRVKAATDYLIIEGKQERKTDTGYVVRKFFRKFKLPEDCHPEGVESSLADNGVLTVVARRDRENKECHCERLIPVSYCGPEEKCVKSSDCPPSKSE